MTEVSFARTFFSVLESKPTKISADHVEDPRSYPSRPPSILPRQAKPFHPPQQPSTSSGSSSTAVPGSERSLTVTLKSLLRNPPLELRLTSQAPSTSVLDVKRAVAQKTGLPVDKMRLLVRKKPVGDAKVLADLVGEGEGDDLVEFSVMVLGGATAAAAPPAGGGGEEGDRHVAAGGLSGDEVLRTDEFWTDLGGFLQQRIRDEEAAGEVLSAFRGAWQGR